MGNVVIKISNEYIRLDYIPAYYIHFSICEIFVVVVAITDCFALHDISSPFFDKRKRLFKSFSNSKETFFPIG